MGNTYRKDRGGKTYKEGLKKKEARYKCRCEYCTGVSKNLICEKIAEKELKTEIKDMENIAENKYSAKNFEYKIEDYINKVVYSLDRFTPLSNGIMIEDLEGEYVLFSSVLNLFAENKS